MGDQPQWQGKRLGEILVGLGFLSDDQLDEILRLQTSTGQRLGEIVLSRGYVAQTQLQWVLATQLGLASVRVDANSVDQELVGRFPAETLRSLLALPIARTDEGLKVAMADPTDQDAIAEIGRLAECPIKPCLTTAQNIVDVLDALGEPETAPLSAVPDVLRAPASGEAEAPPPRQAEAVKTPTVTASDEPVRDLAGLLERLVALGGSDLHASPETAPWARVAGKLGPVTRHPLTTQDVERIRRRVIDDFPDAQTQETGELCVVIDLRNIGRFRAHLSVGVNGWAAAFRHIPSDPPSLEELRLPPVVAQLALRDDGLVLVTGPTGSGRTTTLAAMVALINQSRAAHVITIEPVIEFRHQSQRSLIHQRALGLHTHSSAEAISAALGQNADVVVLGDLAEGDAAAWALRAAQSGHLVLAGVHAPTATAAIRYVLSSAPPEAQDHVRHRLSTVLQGVVAQRLIGRADGEGRVVAAEILVANEPIRNLIREDKLEQIHALLQTSGAEGMQSLDQALNALLMEGLIDEQQARAVSTSAAAFDPVAGPAPPEASPQKPGPA